MVYTAGMQPVLILKVLVLLLLANGAPVIVKRVFGRRLSYPVDGGVRFADGRPLFGPSKTVRGIVAAIALTSAGAPFLGLDWKIGAVIGAAAMAGDLFSSFVKRRMDLPSSGRATGLDQVPESLFPLLACHGALALTAVDIAVGTLVFFLADVVLSRLFFRLGVRGHPY